MDRSVALTDRWQKNSGNCCCIRRPCNVHKNVWRLGPSPVPVFGAHISPTPSIWGEGKAREGSRGRWKEERGQKEGIITRIGSMITWQPCIIIIITTIIIILQQNGARGRCRISPPRFLAEWRQRRLNQGSLFLLYVQLFVFFHLYCVYVHILCRVGR